MIYIKNINMLLGHGYDIYKDYQHVSGVMDLTLIGQTLCLISFSRLRALRLSVLSRSRSNFDHREVSVSFVHLSRSLRPGLVHKY